MSIARAVQRFCSVENDGVSLAVRRRELAELAAIVAAALVALAAAQTIKQGPMGAWLQAVVLLALPFGAAWTLRRTAGRRTFVAAAILETGLLAGLLVSAQAAQTQDLTSNAFVAAGMVWVVSSNPRTPTRTVYAGAAILALAFALAAFL